MSTEITQFNLLARIKLMLELSFKNVVPASIYLSQNKRLKAKNCYQEL